MPRTTKRSSGPDSQADAIEELYTRGVTDGLPVVPPTLTRVERAIEASGRPGDDLIALVPPNYGRATVEKIAVNAVMAGCRPEYLPVVLAGVQAMCEEAFDLHGVSATTNFSSPLFIINGPIRKRLDVNCGVGVFGPGWRANATIGRALRLIAVNLGGARPGVISMSTMGHPGRYTYCIGEYEEENPWEPLHVEHGYTPSDSTVAAFAGDAPQGIYDHRSRTAKELLTTIARSLQVVWHHKATALGDTLVVLSPEHARTIAGDGWSKKDIQRFFWELCQKPVKDLLPGKDGGEGLPEHVLAKIPSPETDETLIPKFRAAGHLKVLVAGGTAGRFSAVIPGWTFPNGSNLVIKKIHSRD
ncbi:MAG: hypothetical protein HYY64_18410 [Candidatus Rokubacteria bacterium]|nr:hypothetical protein [Candidatus Rokubacteria bacterium]